MLTPVHTAALCFCQLNEMMWHPLGNHVLVGTAAGTVNVLAVQPNSLDPVCSLQAHSSTCYCLALSRNQK